ncbi:MAG TPA: hypothetical protein VJU15_07830 [Gemmatimonadales bacterium]|nr:hypothetical protein [Gemmatimonadales bacterium]
MLASAELRWFWKGPRPRLQAWLVSDPHGPCREETRVDHYLSQAGERELGIKRRGAGHGVEIKALVGEGATHAIGTLSARAQIWTKVWTGALNLEGLPTIAVRKSRRMQSHHTGSYTSGCNVEVTEVRAGPASEVWTTLGIEAYGELDRLDAALAGIVRLHQANPPEVDAGHALSYPAWLAGIALAHS